MVGAMMKAFNVTFYDDRRLCHIEGCTDTMIAFKWDHAVRDYMDPEKRFPTLCCLDKEHSQQDPPIDECTETSKYHEVRPCCSFPYRMRVLCVTCKRLVPLACGCGEG
jgi:hypothetical protein